jgi:hypothetical protein
VRLAEKRYRCSLRHAPDPYAIASKLLVVCAGVLLVAGTCEPGEAPREEQSTRANGLIAFVREGRIHTSTLELWKLPR